MILLFALNVSSRCLQLREATKIISGCMWGKKSGRWLIMWITLFQWSKQWKICVELPHTWHGQEVIHRGDVIHSLSQDAHLLLPLILENIHVVLGNLALGAGSQSESSVDNLSRKKDYHFTSYLNNSTFCIMLKKSGTTLYFSYSKDQSQWCTSLLCQWLSATGLLKRAQIHRCLERIY